MPMIIFDLDGVLTSAILYAKDGIPIFPCKPISDPHSPKAPYIKNGFKAASTDKETIRKWWRQWPNAIIGMPTGDNAVAIDIDAKYQPGITNEFRDRAKATGIDWLGRLVRQSTPHADGVHLIYRPPYEVRNTELARNKKGDTTIETRGTGGYIILAPSHGYELRNGRLSDIPSLSIEEQESLFELARSFNLYRIKESPEPKKRNPGGELTPGDDFDARGDVEELLTKHGWKHQGGKNWTRPGKEHGQSATLGYCGERIFYPFSTNSAPFESRRSYSPFAVYAILEHNGDFSEACRALRAEGYGGERSEGSHSGTHGEDTSTETETKGLSPLEKLRSSSISSTEKIAERRAAERNARWILKKIALLSQATVIYSSPNTGKTLLILWLLCEGLKEESGSDIEIYYLNADDDFKGATDKAELMAGSGINMVVPGQEGFEITDFAFLINELIKTEQAQGFVLILDTLKKFTSLMDKEQARAFGNLARKFVQAGGTVISLAHVNKHKDAENKSIYEGAGDVVSDFDAAYTIELDTPRDAADRQVTFENFKSRGPNTLKVSFAYDAGEGKTWQQRFESVRRVEEQTATARIDALIADERFKQDHDCIGYLVSRIASAGIISRRALVLEGLGNGFSRSNREHVLDRYDQSHPKEERRLWKTSTNETGGKSYELLSRGIE